MSVLVSILMVIVLAVGSVFGFYNGMVSSRENVDSQWSQVEIGRASCRERVFRAV